MKSTFFLLLAFCPLVGYGQFSFAFDTGIRVSDGERLLKNPWAGGLNAGQYSTLDMNGDGIADLAVFDRTSDKLNTFLYQDGQYVYSPAYEARFPEDLNAWVVLADYNCDGKKDIFTNAPFGMKLYKNTGTDGNLAWELVADPIYTEGSSGQVNLQVNSSNIPGIVDVDDDGDLDILVFNFAAGGNIEYHQNMALENGGTCEQLVLKRANRRWGDFTECSCGVYAFGDDTCAASGGRVNPDGNDVQKIQHAGGKSILLLDFNGDGIKDLVFSDELCTDLVLLENKGTRDNALFTEAAGSFPNDDHPASLYTFPAAYLEDVDADGLKDLIVAPNVFNNILSKMDFIQSSWWYKNTGTSVKPAFELVQRDFLQDEMIDAGENAVPLFTDYDGDGDADLFIAGKGSLIRDGYYSSIQLWENTGSKEAPQFQLAEDDFLALSTLELTDLKASFGDLDGDGRTDLVFSGIRENSQQLYVLTSSGNEGLNLRLSELKELPVSLSINDTPLAHDVNKDGRADLIIAKATGRLEYHINTGTGTPAFRLENAALAGYKDSFTNRGNIPALGDLNNDGREELVISTPGGELQVIENFMEVTGPENHTAEILYDSLSGRLRPTRLGRHAWPTIADIYGNGLPSLFIGNAQGGVTPLKNRGENTGGGEDGLQLQLFPNPAVAVLYIQPGRDITFEVFTILGQQITGPVEVRAHTSHRLDLTGYRNGVYLLRAKSPAGTNTKRFIVQR